MYSRIITIGLLLISSLILTTKGKEAIKSGKMSISGPSDSASLYSAQ